MKDRYTLLHRLIRIRHRKGPSSPYRQEDLRPDCRVYAPRAIRSTGFARCFPERGHYEARALAEEKKGGWLGMNRQDAQRVVRLQYEEWCAAWRHNQLDIIESLLEYKALTGAGACPCLPSISWTVTLSPSADKRPKAASKENKGKMASHRRSCPAILGTRRVRDELIVNLHPFAIDQYAPSLKLGRPFPGQRAPSRRFDFIAFPSFLETSGAGLEAITSELSRA